MDGARGRCFWRKGTSGGDAKPSTIEENLNALASVRPDFRTGRFFITGKLPSDDDDDSKMFLESSFG